MPLQGRITKGGNVSGNCTVGKNIHLCELHYQQYIKTSNRGIVQNGEHAVGHLWTNGGKALMLLPVAKLCAKDRMEPIPLFVFTFTPCMT